MYCAISAFGGRLPFLYIHSTDHDITIERVNQVFQINDGIDDRQKSSLLLNNCDNGLYKFLCSRTCPDLPHQKHYTELLDILKQYYHKKTCPTRERIIFYNTSQTKSDTIWEWYKLVHTLAGKCNFKQNYQSILLDRFVCGLFRSEISERLMEENETLTLNRAFEIATEMEKIINSRSEEKNRKIGKNRKKKKNNTTTG